MAQHTHYYSSRSEVPERREGTSRLGEIRQRCGHPDCTHLSPWHTPGFVPRGGVVRWLRPMETGAARGPLVYIE